MPLTVGGKHTAKDNDGIVRHWYQSSSADIFYRNKEKSEGGLCEGGCCGFNIILVTAKKKKERSQRTEENSVLSDDDGGRWYRLRFER